MSVLREMFARVENRELVGFRSSDHEQDYVFGLSHMMSPESAPMVTRFFS